MRDLVVCNTQMLSHPEAHEKESNYEAGRYASHTLTAIVAIIMIFEESSRFLWVVHDHLVLFAPFDDKVTLTSQLVHVDNASVFQQRHAFDRVELAYTTQKLEFVEFEDVGRYVEVVGDSETKFDIGKSGAIEPSKTTVQ